MLGLGGNVVATVAVLALFVAKRNAPRTEVLVRLGSELIKCSANLVRIKVNIS